MVVDEMDEEAPSEHSQKAGEVLTKIAESFGLSVTVNAAEDSRAINLRVGGNDVGQLIGRRGRTLGAVQYVISRIINEDRANKKKINIDVDGYNENREKSVSEMAARAVDRVLQNGRPYSFRPMSPQDRRLIHVSLQDHPTIATQSVGEEPNRFVIVYPRSMNGQELDRYIADAASYSERRSRGPRDGGGDGNRSRGRGRGPAREGRDGRESGPPRRRRAS
jgi:spoIIIJ-associated protein